MTKKLLVLAISASLLSGCASMSKEDLGTGFGALAGVAVGSLIGSGSGRVAAIAIGSVLGGFVGKSIGRSLDQKDQEALALASANALENNQNINWKSEHSGASARITNTDAGSKSRKVSVVKPKKVQTIEGMTVINRNYQANKNVNIRSAPGTNNDVVAGLKKGKEVTAIGKTKNNWYLVARGDIVLGYIYGPLLIETMGKQADEFVAVNLDDISSNKKASVASALEGVDLDSLDLEENSVTINMQCRNLNYDLDDGKGGVTKDSTKVCQGDDGAWVL